MIGRLAAQMLDPYFVREEELALAINRKGPIPVRRYRYTVSNGGNAMLNFRARSKAITIIDEIDIYLYQAIGCAGGYYGIVQFDIADNYTREFSIYSNDVSAGGAVNIHWHFGNYDCRILDTTQCELIRLPYTTLLPDEQIRISSSVVADANAATTCLLVYREIDLE